MHSLFAVFCLLLVSMAQASTIGLTPGAHIEKILVLKSQRTLHLLGRSGVTLKTYPIALGKQPTGPKRREGDHRTPEGLYWIDWRKTSDNYNLSMHISYPNARDLSLARQRGHRPGGMIMLHGTPEDDQYPEWFFQTLDWTNGCIALKNSDMREIWDWVQDGTLIEIRP